MTMSVAALPAQRRNGLFMARTRRPEGRWPIPVQTGRVSCNAAPPWPSGIDAPMRTFAERGPLASPATR